MDLFEYIHHYLHLGLYDTLLLLVFIEETGIPLPVPGEAFLVIFGILSLSGRTTYFATMSILLVASLSGSSILYYLSRHFGRPLVEKYGKYIHLSHHQLERMEGWMNKYGGWAVFVTRLLPTVRTAGSIVAGILNVKFSTFFLSTLVSTWIWASIYFFLGAFLGKHYGPALNKLLSNHFFFLGLFAFFLLSAIIIYQVVIPGTHHVKKIRAQRKDHATTLKS